MENYLVFDIETIPDAQAGRQLYGLTALSDSESIAALLNKRRQENGTEFLPHYLQQIVAISVVLRTKNTLKVWSLGSEKTTEAELIERFFEGIGKYRPTLVTWNGAGFDLPVLHYRAMLHKIAAPLYWEIGENDPSFKWNNYLNRFHYRHTDLMDVLAGYQGRALAPLDKLAQLFGFPGKMGMDGAQVYTAYQAGELAAIRAYCETDVLNTYLVFLRFCLFRGTINSEKYAEELQVLRDYLAQENLPHFNEFLDKWTM